QKEKFWFFQGSHQQSDRLSLSSGEKAHFRSKTLFQSQIQFSQLFFIKFSLLSGNTPAESSALPSSCSDSHILFNRHGRSSPGHWILKNSSQINRSFVLRQPGDIYSVHDDFSLIN